MARTSIIIPALNEARGIERTLRHLALLEPPPREIWVVDGGSQDGTVAACERIARRWFAQVPLRAIASPERGRAAQMNCGARAASGDRLCFLHADTLMPDDGVALIERTLERPAIVGGGFLSLMAGSERTCWGLVAHNALKTYYGPLLLRPHRLGRGLRLLFGDQVLFCRRQAFWACGGFDARLPLMEEADLCLRLHHWGRLVQLNRVVQASDRRVARWGALRAHATYLALGVGWGLGVPAHRLKRFYPEVR